MSSLFRNMLDLSNSFGTSRSNPDRLHHSPASADEQRRWQEEAEDLEKSLNDFFGQHQEAAHDAKTGPPRGEHSMPGFLTPRGLEAHPQHDTAEERDEAGRILDWVRDAFYQMKSQHESEGMSQRCSYDSRLRCPYRPDNEGMPEGMPEDSRIAHNGTLFPFWHRATLSSLVGYIDEDPYSPLQLEDRHPFCEHGAKWRRAFADLLAVHHGVDAPCEHQHEEMSKDNWMLALPFYLASQQNRHGDSVTKEPENDAEDDGPTELDLYRHFLGARSPRIPSSSTTQPSSIDTEDHNTSGQPNVISTMTTTQRTTRPDGSVYTQMVLKKRFSDGREESTETEHTTHGAKGSDTESVKQSPRPRSDCTAKPAPALGYDGTVKQAIGRRLEEKKKNGWFWS
ncbi:MAG: hypothetical protein LQ337_000424 [Flavoplaca oasis]|nr:MAG: hypothetical protein LQ337_000424 [Flavoplaca oasis]